MTKRVLITGGFGFIGGRLAEYLIKKGHQVVLGSRTATVPPSWLPEAQVVRTVWDDQTSLERICRGLDVVIHAAGMNAQDCSTNPAAALAFNGLATANLVSAALKADVQRFIYLSTAHVYANPLVGRITEKTCPQNLHPYATSHLAGENAVLYAFTKNLISGSVLRFSNGFGAPSHRDVRCWDLFVNDLCRQAVIRHRLGIRGNAGKHYDFLPMKDLVNAVVSFATVDNKIKDAENTFLINVGAGRSVTLKGMSRLIQSRCEEVLGFKPAITYSEYALSARLHYNSNYSSAAWRNNGSTTTEEIDRLLRFCNTEFKAEMS